eukprot:6793916-Prymnesium_polylepis.1
MSANSRGQPPGLPAPVDVTASRTERSSRPVPAGPQVKWSHASNTYYNLDRLWPMTQTFWPMIPTEVRATPKRPSIHTKVFAINLGHQRFSYYPPPSLGDRDPSSQARRDGGERSGAGARRARKRRRKGQGLLSFIPI